MTTIKAYDTAVEFTDTLTVAGAPFDLTDCTVTFNLARTNLKNPFSAPATIVNAAAGTVSYLPTEGFPVRKGDYYQEWEVTTPENLKLTFPSDSYNRIRIIADIET